METSLLVEDGLPFPHIGGPIDVAAVVETHAALRDGEGNFAMV